jgi:hypothetical protein
MVNIVGTIKTKDLVKGDIVYLKHTNWKAEILSKPRANVAFLKVWGNATECGDTYLKEIAYVVREEKNYLVRLTEKQQGFADMLEAMGF